MPANSAVRQSTRSRSWASAADNLVRSAEIRLVLPWWANPLWALILLTGSMAVISVVLPPDDYREWLTPKYLSTDLSLVLLVLFLAMAIGMFFGTGLSPRARVVDLRLDESKLKMLDSAYRVLLALTVAGYAAWVISAAAQGVGINSLLAVLERSQGAIGDLKENARPIGGVTTLTQFAPIAVALNILLWKAGIGHRLSLLFLFLGALARVFFYAERLALIEVVVPAALIGAMILSADTRWRKRLAVAPIIALPIVWGIFALSEYFRSWIYYQHLTDLPFLEWVTLRLIGYYTTSFNNSALLAEAYHTNSSEPWFSMQWFWNLPGVENAIQHPGIGGLTPPQWWDLTLEGNANVNFTNTGSFLATYAEWGLPASVGIWLVTGLVFGLIFNALSRGNVPALLLYASMFVGILELPRLIYWTLGRSTPIIIAFVFLAYHWAKLSRKQASVSSIRHPRPQARPELQGSTNSPAKQSDARHP